ncbi:hypothetical protein [Fluviicola sp.]|uniref:hypothetical protein n=1 Tax=Fluviicola sp. TaxID=1917219 RepID=UPI0031D53138
MKKIVILQLFFFVAVPCVFSQDGSQVQTTQQNITYQYVSEKSKTESLEVIYGLVDQCSLSEFNKLHEHFVYKARTEPTDRNRAILEYIKNKKNQPK